LNYRLARAYTAKDKILKFEGHYHGWSDEEWVSHNPPSVSMLGPRNKPWKVLSSPGQRLAALDDVIILPWNDLDLVRQVVKRHGHEIAAVITEPVMCNCEPVMPKPGFLEGLRAITRENEIVLIFDEVITGFRLALGGAQEYYSVVPDLCTFAKAVAGGYPLAGVAGKREILEAGVQPVGTFNCQSHRGPWPAWPRSKSWRNPESTSKWLGLRVVWPMGSTRSPDKRVLLCIQPALPRFGNLSSASASL